MNVASGCPQFTKLSTLDESNYVKDDVILSLAFRNGYKMCIRAYLNGDGSGYKTHLSLFFVVMKGEYDALLKWPFDYKVSMILVGKENEGLVTCTCPQSKKRVASETWMF